MCWFICRAVTGLSPNDVTRFYICTTAKTFSTRPLRLQAWNGASTKPRERLIKESLIEPLIIVAVANIGEERIHEYAPTRGVIDTKAKRKKRSKGLAQMYGQFLIDELKPYIDRKYRTNPECGIYRIRRFVAGRFRYTCDWDFVSAGLQSTHGDVAVNLVGRFRDLSTRRILE